MSLIYFIVTRYLQQHTIIYTETEVTLISQTVQQDCKTNKQSYPSTSGSEKLWNVIIDSPDRIGHNTQATDTITSHIL